MARSIGIRVKDNAPTINLENNFTAPKSIGSRPIVVTRNGNLSIISTVPYYIVPMSASASDYTTSPTGTLTFGPGVSSLTIPNSIVNTAGTIPTKQYRFELGNDDSSWSRGNNFCIITIIDGATGGTLSALSRIVAFETPYGMLNASQRTSAQSNNGGYITVAASRSDTTTDNYAVYMSTTLNGTYTKAFDNLTYSPYAEVNNAIPYNHQTIGYANPTDLPVTIPTNTIGLMVDGNGNQEFGLYSAYGTQTLQGATAALFTGVRSAIFDTVPIAISNQNSAQIYLLNNLTQDNTLRSNGSVVYIKIVPKNGIVEYDNNLVSAIPITISGRANKPLIPRNVQFGYLDANNKLNYSSYPSYQFPRADLYLTVDTSSRVDEVTPSGFFTPSGLNESGVTYEVDIIGADGFIRTLPITLGATNTAVYSMNQRENVDREYGITTYNFYAKSSGGIRSLPYSFNLDQSVRIIPNVNTASSVVAGANVNITVTLNSTSTSPFAIDYFLGGSVFTTQAFGAITCTNGVILVPNQRVQIPPSINSFVMTIPTISATGKTLTTSWGANQDFPTTNTL